MFNRVECGCLVSAVYSGSSPVYFLSSCSFIIYLKFPVHSQRIRFASALTYNRNAEHCVVNLVSGSGPIQKKKNEISGR